MISGNRTERLWGYYRQRVEQRQASVSLRNTVAVEYQNLVRKIAHRMARQCPEPYKDLEQLGNIGLLRAIERYNPTTGASFSSFAIPYIQGEMLHHLRDHGTEVKIPRRWREIHAQAARVERKWVAQGKTFTQSDIAQHLHQQRGGSSCPAAWGKKLSTAREAIANQKAVSLEEKHYDLAIVHPQEQSENLLPEAWASLRARFSSLEPEDQFLIQQIYFDRCPRKLASIQRGVSERTLRLEIQRILRQLSA